MLDGRYHLPIGTMLALEQGTVYKITGEPMGWGGGSILYPALRLISRNGTLCSDGFHYALKECYPASLGHFYIRNDQGEIIPQSSHPEDEAYLRRSQQLLLEESTVSRRIYQTASRMLPILESAQNLTVTLPGMAPAPVANTVTVMESLSEKGRSLSAWLKERHRFSPAETLRIIQQLLFSLREVHRAGFLHLDIQDGNVFLRGTLEDKSELVTLIDFGAARPLENDKTAPVRDRVIFTTPGFSAPEILLHNDGSLQLGPEADLYSVGCLALYLLTGQRPDSKLLLANRTGLYLKVNQLRRIKCPPHLTDQLQKLLSRALEKEPERRYHSAEEMLADVSALADALHPYRSDLNAVKYDAFVCYKHGDVDSAAALTLQRALENYRAPKGVAKTRKPFRRVFVDEGELSSCADFGQQIREALKNAGWLIVVCSPDTPTSPWVQLEIDTFLEYHDRSRILAVLTGGDERNAFPPQLKGAKDGTGEVLAADARGDDLTAVLRNLKKDALLKLAAPMLGTTFDTLKQRQKLYRMQRIAAVTAGFLAATAGFAAYAVNRANVIEAQALRIEQEYRNALINESRFLTGQAQKQLDNNDPLSAMELSLQALPSEAQDRPVVTEAEYVLGKALGIYKTPSGAENTASAVGMIKTELPSFTLDCTGTRLLLWDDWVGSGSVLQAWSTEDLTCQWEHSLDSIMKQSPIVCRNDRLLILSASALVCLDSQTGQELWHLDTEDTICAAVSENEQEVLLLTGDQGDYFGPGGNDSPARDLTACVLSADTGTCLHTVSFPLDGGQYVCSNICISPDLKWAAIPTVDEGYDDFIFHDYNSLYLADLDTGDCRLLFDSQTDIQTMAFLNGHLVLTRSSGYTMRTREGNAICEYLSPITMYLECYRPDTGSQCWSTTFRNYLKDDCIDKIEAVRYTLETDSREGILFTFLDQCVLADPITGSVIRNYELYAPAMDIQYNSNGFETINADGTCTKAGYGITSTLNISYFSSNVTGACRSGNTFFIQSAPEFEPDYTIRKYELNKSDSSYSVLYEAPSQNWTLVTAGCGEAAAPFVLVKDQNLCYVNSDTGDIRQYQMSEDTAFSMYQILGLSSDHNRLYWSEYDPEYNNEHWIESKIFHMIDLVSGTMTEINPPEPPSAHLVVLDTLFLEETLFFSAASYDSAVPQYYLYAWNFREGLLSELYHTKELPLDWNFLFNSLSVDSGMAQIHTAIGPEEPRILLCTDLQTGSTGFIQLDFPLPRDADAVIPPSAHFAWNRDCSMAFFDFLDAVYAVDADGGLIWKIPVKQKVLSIALSPDESSLLLFFDDNTIAKHRLSDGSCLGQLNLADYSNTSGAVGSAAWEFIDDNTLLLLPDNSNGFLLDITGETLALKAVVEKCIGYDARTDAFLICEDAYYSGQSTTIGCFRRYRTEDLIRMAADILNK